MKTKYLAMLVCTALLALISLGAAGTAAEGGNLTLTQEYDLVGERSLETQYYLMERDIRLIAEDGTPKGMEVTSFGVTYITADIYLDLASKWMKKAEIIVVDSTKAIMGDQVIDRTIVQTINTIKAVSEAEFRAL